jgi:hypothetical protein
MTEDIGPRDQTVSLARFGSEIAWGAPVVSALVVGGFIATTAFVVVHGVNESPIALTVLGALVAKFGTVVDYWLGSSSSSRAKDAVIAGQGGQKP